MNSVAKRLTWLRGVSGLERPELEALAGLYKGHVWLIEHGNRGEKGELSAATVLGLARVLGCTAEWLLSGRGAPPADAQVLAAVAAARAEAARDATHESGEHAAVDPAKTGSGGAA
jgi:transcriptional regulator with XRE-family HTH domain